MTAISPAMPISALQAGRMTLAELQRAYEVAPATVACMVLMWMESRKDVRGKRAARDKASELDEAIRGD